MHNEDAFLNGIIKSEGLFENIKSSASNFNNLFLKYFRNK